jgi:DNA mismatch endonuclease (patch repair protein)
MPDNLTADQRKKAMSQVQQRDTKPEKIVRSLLHRLGFRFRKNVSSLAGNPDVVLPKYKTIIFVHGCFWHQHKGCRKANRPTSNTEFWNTKLDKNVKRDKETIKLLKRLGWKVIIIWECELKNAERIENIKKKLVSKLSTTVIIEQ